MISVQVRPQNITRFNGFGQSIFLFISITDIRTIKSGNHINIITSHSIHFIPVTKNLHLFIGINISHGMSFLITAYPNNLLCFRVENLSTALTVVLISIIRKFNNLIMYQWSIKREIPVKALRITNQAQVTFHFKTGITETSQICFERIKTGIARQINISQQIRSRTVIIIQYQVITIIQESQIQPQLKGFTLFPFQFRINNSCI